ncbi:MAG: hydrolase [Hyphomicrobiales bacterium]
MLSPHDTALLMVDIQEKLLRAMHGREELVLRARQLAQGSSVLGVPVLCTEQNPKGLGSTVPEITACLPGVRPIAKFSFSCCASEEFMQALTRVGRRHVIMAGIETHVCVYQTATDLLAAGYNVEVAADACSSRTPENKQIGLEKCRRAGVAVTSVETALFELLKVAEGPLFKQILNIVK